MSPAEPPRYVHPQRLPNLMEIIRDSPSDPLGVLPETMFEAESVALPAPGAPVLICEPETAEKILFDTGTHWGRNTQTRRLIRRAWGAGLAAAEGDSWRLQRRAAAPALRAQAMGGYVPAMAQAAQDAVETWQHAGQLDLSSAMGAVVSRTVLNTLLTGSDKAEHAQLADDIAALMRQITQFGMLDMLPLPEAVIDRLRGLPASPARRRLLAFASRLATTRAEGPDVVEDLPALMRDAGPLVDNIFGFMTASFETSAVGAAWALYLLALYPDWQDRVREEAEQAAGLPGADHLAALTLTRQVVREALRLYPPAPLLARSCITPTQVLGHAFRKNQVAMIGVYALHRHTALWEAPHAFRPDRFSDNAPTRHRASYIPFSAGPRMCAAAVFAETEICVLVSHLIRNITLAPTGPAPEVNLRVTTHSTTGLWVKTATA